MMDGATDPFWPADIGTSGHTFFDNGTDFFCPDIFTDVPSIPYIPLVDESLV